MQITLNIDGKDLAPTLQGVLDAMTDDDKRKLATDMAREYFVSRMGQKSGDHWNSQSGAERFLEDLTKKFRSVTAEAIASDPQCAATVKAVLEKVREEFPAMVQNAVMAVLAQQVSGVLSSMLTVREDHSKLRRELSEHLNIPALSQT